MARYWYRTSNGTLSAQAAASPRPIGHSGYGLTPDIADLPGPIECCTWDGSQVVVDSVLFADFKARLARKVEENAFNTLQDGVLTTPWGDFRVRKDDIDAYQMIAFSALYAINTNNTTWSVTVRKTDGTNVTVTAAQFIRFMSLIGDRMSARLTARNAKLEQLESATAAQLKSFSV